MAEFGWFLLIGILGGAAYSVAWGKLCAESAAARELGKWYAYRRAVAGVAVLVLGLHLLEPQPRAALVAFTLVGSALATLMVRIRWFGAVREHELERLAAETEARYAVMNSSGRAFFGPA